MQPLRRFVALFSFFSSLRGPVSDRRSLALISLGVIVATFSVAAFTAQPAMAGKYELVKGKGVEVCEAYEQSLNSFEPKVPMVCGRPVSTKLGFDKPKWEQPENISLSDAFLDFGEYLWGRDVNPVRYSRSDQWPQWKGTPAQMKIAHEYYLTARERLWIDKPPLLAEFDIDNDGQPDHVYFEHPCGSVYGDLFAVLTPDYKAVDRVKTERLMVHPPFKKLGLGALASARNPDGSPLPEWARTGYLKPVGDAISHVHYDFFYFRRKVYLDQWWRDHPSFQGEDDMKVGLLRVFETNLSGTQEICTYRFKVEG